MNRGISEKSSKYKRIVLKLSGEMLCDRKKVDPIDRHVLDRMAQELKEVHEMGVQICLVVGGGNIFRGLSGEKARGVVRSTGDYMGMLATVINGMAFMDSLEKMGVDVRVQTAISMKEVAEPFILRRAVRHLERGRFVIFVAGTGNPYFSTDTAAALRANEVGAEIILKGTKVDGVYDKDPILYPDAKKYKDLTFMQALKERLTIMDSTAFSLCLDNNIPIMVFDVTISGNIKRAILGEPIGTLVH